MVREFRTYQAPKSMIKTATFTHKIYFSKNLIFLFAAIFIMVAIIFLGTHHDNKEYLIGIATTLVVYIVAINMLWESNLFNRSWLKEKYHTSGIRDRVPEIFSKTQSYFERSPDYLEADFSLSKLSLKLHIPSSYISQAIRETTDLTFNEYLGKYRIQEAQKRIISQEFSHLTLEAIGKSVGYKSKTSFNNAFKKHVRMTPSQFRNQHKT